MSIFALTWSGSGNETYVPVSRACPVYGAAGSMMVDGDVVAVAKLDVVLAITVARLPLFDLEAVAVVVLPTIR